MLTYAKTSRRSDRPSYYDSSGLEAYQGKSVHTHPPWDFYLTYFSYRVANNMSITGTGASNVIKISDVLVYLPL